MGAVSDELDKMLVDAVYEEIKARIPEAKRVLQSEAPPYRDIKANTYVFLSDDSDSNTAVIVFRSDSKDPDVLTTAGKRRPGRPKGARTGQRSPRRPYANGVDLANITNGARARGSHRTSGTSRRTRMPTHGWWERGVDKAVAVFER